MPQQGIHALSEPHIRDVGSSDNIQVSVGTHGPRERERYHQLHPAKLVTDWGTAILAGGLLWRREWLTAIAIGFVPSIVVTAVFLSGRLDDALERIRRKPVFQSIALNLTAAVNAIRFAGLALSWAGCWFHQAWMIPAGVLVIASGWWFAWRRGLSDRAGPVRTWRESK